MSIFGNVWWRCVALVLVMFSLSAFSPDETGDTSQEARAAMEAYVEALNSGDIEAAAEMYDTDPGFHWIERGGLQYDSGSQAADALRQLAQFGGSTRMTMEQIRVAPMGDSAALVSGYFTITQLSKDGLPLFSFDGWMTVGMVKHAESWRIAGGQTGPGPTENSTQRTESQ